MCAFICLALLGDESKIGSFVILCLHPSTPSTIDFNAKRSYYGFHFVSLTLFAFKWLCFFLVKIACWSPLQYCGWIHFFLSTRCFSHLIHFVHKWNLSWDTKRLTNSIYQILYLSAHQITDGSFAAIATLIVIIWIETIKPYTRNHIVSNLKRMKYAIKIRKHIKLMLFAT